MTPSSPLPLVELVECSATFTTFSVITDPDAPGFDLEKLLLSFEKQ